MVKHPHLIGEIWNHVIQFQKMKLKQSEKKPSLVMEQIPLRIKKKTFNALNTTSDGMNVSGVLPRQTPLVAVVIMTGTKEEARRSCYRVKSVVTWTTATQDFQPTVSVP